MKFGIQYKQGEILIVPFPFSNLSNVKRRPVLILSSDKDNKNSEDLIICGITSNLKDKKHSVAIENPNLLVGQIPFKSLIKIDKLFSIEKSIVIKKIAKLNQDTFEKVKKEFYSLI